MCKNIHSNACPQIRKKMDSRDHSSMGLELQKGGTELVDNHVCFSYNPSFSACFFSQNSVSLATNQPEQCFGLFFQRSEWGCNMLDSSN